MYITVHYSPSASPLSSILYCMVIAGDGELYQQFLDNLCTKLSVPAAFFSVFSLDTLSPGKRWDGESRENILIWVQASSASTWACLPPGPSVNLSTPVSLRCQCSAPSSWCVATCTPSPCCCTRQSTRGSRADRSVGRCQLSTWALYGTWCFLHYCNLWTFLI